LGEVHPDLGQVVAVGLGQLGKGVDSQELIDLGKTSEFFLTSKKVPVVYGNFLVHVLLCRSQIFTCTSTITGSHTDN
jgi:hypothetical protein